MRVRVWPVVVALGAGCAHANPPRAVSVIGPDGAPALHVSCGNHEGECYRMAGQSCPYGYAIERSAGAAGNFLVRCRSVKGAGGTWPPSSELTASPYGPPSSIAWPPPTELLPSPYATTRRAPEPLPSPYPSPRPTATAGYPPLAPSAAPPPKDDVGY